MEDEILLEVRNLHTDFVTAEKTVKVVDGVSFRIIEGETFGLIGESGCGKSVTCKSLIRLMRFPGRITGGEILYKGENILTYKEKEMQRIRGREITMIFQNPMTTLNPVLTIKEQLLESMQEKDKSKKERILWARELLQMVGISNADEMMNAYAHQLSGGMRQRVMIAIALAARPNLLLADEPTTALDVTIQAQIIKLLKKLKNDLHMSMLLVTHDLAVAAQMCDHIAVMYAGKIMEVAEADTIFRRPRNPYTYGLLRSVPSVNLLEPRREDERIYSINGTPPDMNDMPQGCPFAPRCEFCEDRCNKEVPELTLVEEGHFSRCHCLEKMKHIKGVLPDE